MEIRKCPLSLFTLTRAEASNKIIFWSRTNLTPPYTWILNEIIPEDGSPCWFNNCSPSGNTLMFSYISSTVGNQTTFNAPSTDPVPSPLSTISLPQSASSTEMAPTTTMATPGSTATTGRPTSSEFGTINTNSSSGSSSSGNHTNWEAVGAVVAIASLLVALGAWWSNRKTRWAMNAIERLIRHQHNTQAPQGYNHPQHQTWIQPEWTRVGE